MRNILSLAMTRTGKSRVKEMSLKSYKWTFYFHKLKLW